MSAFWLAASALTAVALGFVALPLWWQQQRTGRWPLVPLVAGLLVVPLAFGLYFQVRTWTPTVAHGDPSVSQMVAQLAARLKRNPDDPAGWRMLGRSYFVLGDWAHSRDAYREAWARSPEHDDDLKLSLAEAEALTDRGALKGEAGQLVEEVLKAEPNNMKALWYGGLAAHDSGREELARKRWSALLAQNPPAQIVDVLSSQFGVTAPGNAAAAPPAGAAPVAAAAPSTAASGTAIKVSVKLGDDVSKAQLGTKTWLLVFARAPGGGPPVAVIRQPATAVPGEFTLSDANSMIPGRSLGNFPELTVVARLSASGQAIEQPGDLYGQAQVAPGGAANLVIDRVVQ